MVLCSSKFLNSSVGFLWTTASVFFKDTPASLITKYSAEKAYEDLLYIAKVNGITDHNLTSLKLNKPSKTFWLDWRNIVQDKPRNLPSLICSDIDH